MTTLFISDLHLDQNRPDNCAQFEAFLQGPATQAEAEASDPTEPPAPPSEG